MRSRWQGIAVLASVVCALGLVLLPAAPAAAATPQCTQAVDHLPDGPSGGIWVPAAANYNRLCWMQRYNYSDGVWALQRALRICYGENIAVDKDYGPATRDALRRVQGRIGAFQDGKYGPETARLMKFSSSYDDHPGSCAWQTF